MWKGLLKSEGEYDKLRLFIANQTMLEKKLQQKISGLMPLTTAGL